MLVRSEVNSYALYNKPWKNKEVVPGERDLVVKILDEMGWGKTHRRVKMRPFRIIRKVLSLLHSHCDETLRQASHADGT